MSMKREKQYKELPKSYLIFGYGWLFSWDVIFYVQKTIYFTWFATRGHLIKSIPGLQVFI